MNSREKLKGRTIQYLGWPLYFAIAVAVMNVVMFFVGGDAGLVMLPLTILCAASAGALLWYRRNGLRQDILNLTADNARIQHQLLCNMPAACGVINASGKVLWGNDRLWKQLPLDRGGRKPLWSVIPEVKEKDFPLKENEYIRHIRLDDRYYRLEIENVDVPEEAAAADMLGLRNEKGGI